MSADAQTEIFKEARQAIELFKTAQSMGRIATKLEQDATELRHAVGELNLKPLHAPEGRVFNVAVNNHESTLVIEPFNHSKGEWGYQYQPGDDEYVNLVKKSLYGDDANIDVDILEYSPGEARIWGYNSSRRVRVLIDHTVRVDFVSATE